MALPKEDLPINKKFSSDLDYEQYQYVVLRPSNLEEDVGQTTIPLLDVQPVEPIPHVPISGVGIYHKATLSSGFIGIKLQTFDIEPHIDLGYLKKEAEEVKRTTLLIRNRFKKLKKLD